MGKWAPWYDALMTVLTIGREKKLRHLEIELSRIRPGDSVLEIGCGTGTLTLAAKEHAGSGRVAGIDIAPEMVARAQKKAVRKGVDVSFTEGSIAAIPFPDKSFDVVMCSFMIFHMPDDVQKAGIAEISRVLKQGGHLFIFDAVSLDPLVPVLKENAFTGIEPGNIKFIYMAISYLRAQRT
ncbi:MAG: putative methyltransferase YcgJ [Syntrophus sp. PtaB.Bin138]|nr:MAG: putative methyltransferase YcgJ [Syntrophus sp. PtaB.Bin138]